MTYCRDESHDFVLPQEALSLGVPSFDPDLGLDISGAKPEDPRLLLEAARENVRRYGFDFDPESPSKTVKSISAEVGDDEIDVSNNICYTGLLRVFHERLGMKVSEEDTSITQRYGNYTEELIILPDSYYQTYHNARNRSDFRDMSYMDTCKIRLATDIRPMRMEHSATNDGKAAMVGRRQHWIPPGRWRARYDVFSLFQDIHLDLHRDKKFAYLPESLGGYGKRVPFEQRGNLERFIKTFRGGTHQRLIRAIVRRLTSWYKLFREGRNPGPDALLAFVSRFTSGFHDWIKGHSLYAPVTWIGVPPEVAAFRARLSTRDPLQRDVISRLLAEGILVPESQVQIVHEHNEFCRGLLGKENVLDVRESISAKRREWLRNSSIFSMEAYGYIKEITIDNEGWQPLIDVETAAFLKVIDDQSLFNLKLQLRDEPVYNRRVIDELYARGPMKVRFQMYPRYLGHTIFAHRDFRSEVIDTEEIGHLEELQKWFDDGQVGPPPRRLLNDDNSIIQSVHEAEQMYAVIITDDKRLCREANRKTRKPIFRVPMEWYYRSLYFGEPGTPPWIDFIQQSTGVEWYEILDEGSARSFEENYFKDGMPLSRPARQRFSLLRPERHSTKIEVVESENFDARAPPDARPDTFLYDYRNQLRLRRSQQRA